jgi:hypothetical protein
MELRKERWDVVGGLGGEALTRSAAPTDAVILSAAKRVPRAERSRKISNIMCFSNVNLLKVDPKPVSSMRHSA